MRLWPASIWARKSREIDTSAAWRGGKLLEVGNRVNRGTPQYRHVETDLWQIRQPAETGSGSWRRASGAVKRGYNKGGFLSKLSGLRGLSDGQIPGAARDF